MSQIRLTVLGTSASAPTKERGLPAVLLEYLGEGFLFDVGEGTQRQFMRFGRSFMRVNHIFISHFHGDHVFGLPGLLSTMGLYGRIRALTVWAPSRHAVYVEQFLRDTVQDLPFSVEIRGVDPGIVLETDRYRISAYALQHTTDCVAYVFSEPDRLKADKQKLSELGVSGPAVGRLKSGECITWNGRRICPDDVLYTVPGRKVAYVADTRPVHSDLLDGADVLVHESTFLDSDRDLAIEKGHSTAVEAATVARDHSVKQLVLFHFSPRIKDLSAVEEEARHIFVNSTAAWDGYTLEI